MSKVCENCGSDIWIYEGEFYDVDGMVTEYYCNHCLANIFEEDPTQIHSVKRVEESF